MLTVVYHFCEYRQPPSNVPIMHFTHLLYSIVEMLSIAKCFGTDPSNPRWNPNADIHGDGKIDIMDIFAVAKHFG